MTSATRRVFILQLAAGGTALAAAAGARAEAAKRLEESDPKAVSLGYKHDSSQVDQKRFPKHGASERCGNCMAFLGKPKDAMGECDLLVDKLVSSTGWCSSYVKAA